MSRHIQPPTPLFTAQVDTPSVFLAGTIDGGDSKNWQGEAAYKLTEIGYSVYNPRRDDWDSSWTQEYTNPHFFQQVTWELNALEISTFILMNFLPKSKSPISLLELGLHAASKKMIVVCPKDFYRKGNVDIVVDRFMIPTFRTMSAGIEYLKDIFESM